MPKRKRKQSSKKRKQGSKKKSSGAVFDAEVRAHLERVIAEYERGNHVKTENQAKKQPVQMAPAPSGR